MKRVARGLLGASRNFQSPGTQALLENIAEQLDAGRRVIEECTQHDQGGGGGGGDTVSSMWGSAKRQWTAQSDLVKLQKVTEKLEEAMGSHFFLLNEMQGPRSTPKAAR